MGSSSFCTSKGGAGAPTCTKTDAVETRAVHSIEGRRAAALADLAEHLRDDGRDDLAVLLVLAQLLVQESKCYEVLQRLAELLRRKVGHVFDHGVLLLPGDFRHQAAVQNPDAAIVQQQEVAGVRVAVQKAGVQELRQVHVEEDADVRLDALFLGRVRDVHARNFHSVDPLGHERVPRRSEDLGHLHHIRQVLDALQVVGQAGGGAGLAVVVQLVDEARAVHVDHLDGAQAVAADPRLGTGDLRYQAKDAPADDQIAGAGLQQSGALHFHRHVDFLAGRRAVRRLVHLAQAGAGDGLIKIAARAKDVLDASAKLFLQDGNGDRAVKRLHAVLQLCEVLRIRLGQKVRPNAQGLADLDERRAELRQRLHQLLRALGCLLRGSFLAPDVVVVDDACCHPSCDQEELELPEGHEQDALLEVSGHGLGLERRGKSLRDGRPLPFQRLHGVAGVLHRLGGQKRRHGDQQEESEDGNPHGQRNVPALLGGEQVLASLHYIRHRLRQLPFQRHELFREFREVRALEGSQELLRRLRQRRQRPSQKLHLAGIGRESRRRDLRERFKAPLYSVSISVVPLSTLRLQTH
mmetsp:Transcript_4781/g.19156  ORF Transcript_4781/g.19156 Transcript_4781/m.19156 type:complete len:579 (+) Transcript_4781:793-2529(+)